MPTLWPAVFVQLLYDQNAPLHERKWILPKAYGAVLDMAEPHF